MLDNLSFLLVCMAVVYIAVRAAHLDSVIPRFPPFRRPDPAVKQPRPPHRQNRQR